MGLMNRAMEAMASRMSKEDKERMMNNITDKFFRGMTDDEKQRIMNNMMDRFLASMTPSERQKMMAEMIPKMMEGISMAMIMPQMRSAMMRGGRQEGGMMNMRPMMVSMMGSSAEPGKSERSYMPVMESPEDFKPWQFCPCRKLCERGFKT